MLKIKKTISQAIGKRERRGKCCSTASRSSASAIFCRALPAPNISQTWAPTSIKVEPIDGAHERRWSGADVYVEGVSGFYLCANRNKRSIGIDLKSAEGKEVARRLIAAADVVMENFRPGVFAKLGFDQRRSPRSIRI